MRLCSTKELAMELGRSERYIRQMKREGFKMDGRRATVEEAREWLRKRGNRLRWKDES